MENRKEILHPEAEKYIDQLELEAQLRETMIFDLIKDCSQLKRELAYVYECIVKGPPDHKINSEDLARIAQILKR